MNILSEHDFLASADRTSVVATLAYGAAEKAGLDNHRCLATARYAAHLLATGRSASRAVNQARQYANVLAGAHPWGAPHGHC